MHLELDPAPQTYKVLPSVRVHMCVHMRVHVRVLEHVCIRDGHQVTFSIALYLIFCERAWLAGQRAPRDPPISPSPDLGF